jgi:hypothetical protein
MHVSFNLSFIRPLRVLDRGYIIDVRWSVFCKLLGGRALVLTNGRCDIPEIITL